jgi:hypothetical protein
MTDRQIGLRRFLAGGIAGCLTWTIAYPADYIKTHL